MSDQNISCCAASSTSSQSLQLLAVRSGFYALLGRGFSNPDQSVVDFFQQAAQKQMEAPGKMASSLKALLEAASQAELDQLQRAYMLIFDPVSGPFPYEVEHRPGHEFAKAQIMADLMGFYRAFAVEPRTERPDHIGAELEFMHLLTLKEARALESGQADKAQLCREAQEKFLREHLLSWYQALLKAMRSKLEVDSLIFYRQLLNVFELFIETEKENLT